MFIIHDLYNKHIFFLILAILVIAFLWNKNEYLDAADKDNLNVKNITATGIVTFPGAKQAVKQGDGLTVFNDPGFGGANWIRGDRNYISGSANIGKDLTVDGTITANKIISKDGSSSGPLSNEAVQNIASVYNKDNLTVTNLNATGMITFPGAKQAVQQGNGKTSFNDTYGANWIRGDRNVISGSANIAKDLTVEGVINAKNITATGMITFPGAKQAVKQGDGLTTFNDRDGSNWIRGDNNIISGSVQIGGSLNATGGFKTPLDMTRFDAKMMNVWNDTGDDNSFCPDGYYMYGVTKATEKRGSTFNPACRKLPGA